MIVQKFNHFYALNQTISLGNPLRVLFCIIPIKINTIIVKRIQLLSAVYTLKKKYQPARFCTRKPYSQLCRLDKSPISEFYRIIVFIIQFHMYFDRKQKQASNQESWMRSSIKSVGKFSVKQSQLIQRLNEPISTKLIKQFSKPTCHSQVGQKTSSLKIKKYESLETNTTEEYNLMAEEQKFINSYKSDVFFRKKVDMLIKQHEKRVKQKQEKQISTLKNTSFQQNTWRTQRNAQEMDVLKLYQRCKKWISKSNQAQ